MGLLETVQQAFEDEKTLSNANLDTWELDASQEYEEPHFLAYRDGIGTLPKGDITTLSAKAKIGKSYCASILEVVVLGGGSEFNFETEETGAKVLHFDTEQSIANCARVQRRVHRLMGWDTKVNYERFRFFSLRTMPMQDRADYIVNKTIELAPTLIIIDGIADLILNFNDIQESSAIIEKLNTLSTSADCAILTILHENKGKDDVGMKGHLGTLLLQKSASVFHLKKGNSSVQVENTDSRNRPLETWSFSIAENGMPIPCINMADEKEKEMTYRLEETLRRIFKDGTPKNMNALVSAWMIEEAVSESTAKRRIRTAREKELLGVKDSQYIYTPQSG